MLCRSCDDLCKVGEDLLGKGENLGRGDGLQCRQKIGRKTLVDMCGNHLAVAVGYLKDPVNAADEVAHHVVAHAVEFVSGDGLLPQAFYLAVDFTEGVESGLGGDIGCDEKDDAATEYLGGTVNAIGIAFVFAQVAHQPGTEVAAQHGVEYHELGIVLAMPGKRKKVAEPYC